MTDYRVSKRTDVTLTGTSILVGDLADLLNEMPRNDVVHIQYYAGDPRDQRERSHVTLSVRPST